LHGDAVELRFGSGETLGRVAGADEFAGEDAGFLRGLLGLRRVALCAFRGRDDERAGFVFDGFEGCDVAVEFAEVLTDELVAFADLDLGVRFEEDGFDGFHGDRQTCDVRRNCLNIELVEESNSFN